MLKKDLIQEKVKFITQREFDQETKEHLEKELEKFFDLYDKKFNLDSLEEFRVEIKEMHKEGHREEFEIQATLFTNSGDFHAKKASWNLIGTFTELVKAIRKQVWSE